MDTIEAIKAKLQYSTDAERESAYASWFIVVAVLADAYADAGMMKKETICRWIIREGRIPAEYHGAYWWWWTGDDGVPRTETWAMIPLSHLEMLRGKLFGTSNLVSCLNQLLSVTDEYLGRFH